MRARPPSRLLLAAVVAASLGVRAPEGPRRAAAADAPEPPRPGPVVEPASEPVVERDVVYGRGGTTELRLDVVHPATGEAPWPAVLLLHGGGWRSGARGDLFARALALARRGYLAATADYRLAPADPFPAAVEDVSCAVRFLRAQAGPWRLHPRRIAVWGEEEGGGHLALLLGVLGAGDGFHGTGGHAAHARDVQAVVAFHAPSDLTTWRAWTSAEPFLVQRYGKGSEGLLADFLAARERASPALARASPTTYVSAGDAPVLSVHGDADPVVPVEQARALHRALRVAGVAERLVEVPGGAHGLGGAQREAADAAALAFLDERLRGVAPAAAAAAPPAAAAPADPGGTLELDLVYRRVGATSLHLDLARPVGDGGDVRLKQLDEATEDRGLLLAVASEGG